jgi:DNA-binding NtrC family response regulator
MLDAHLKILIVDEDDPTRTSLTLIFSELGYRVRSCEDGFSALSEIRKDIPDVLLSDLNMTGGPGLKFLMVVRRWFPSVRVIAMGGTFSGNRVPPGVAADVFYQKDAGPVRLIEQVESMTQPKRLASRLSMDDLFRFQVFEAIPSHPNGKLLTFPANRTIVFPVRQREHPGELIPFAAVTRIQEVCSL